MRNPFRIRASQRAVSDDEFVKLFGAGALGLLENVPDPWGGVVFLRSAPGGGKTTFMRLLTPRPLQLTSRLVENPQVKTTHDALREVGAIGDSGPQLLGAMVAFTSEYRDLAGFDRGNSVFKALLNSRIVIATLRAILERCERDFPDDLATIEAEWEPESDATIPGRADGRQLFAWASEIERDFYNRLDDLSDQTEGGVGHPRFDGLKWFAAAKIKAPRPLCGAKRVLLLDELQTLAPAQRTALTEFVTNARADCGVWIAERLEALTHHDLLSEGALQERDYQDVIQLERRWFGGSRSKSYSKFVEQIAALRAAKADNFDNRDFFSLIAEQDDPVESPALFDAASAEIERRLISANPVPRYNLWFEEARAFGGTPLERAIRWRLTEIMIARDRNRPQASFAFDALLAEELEPRNKTVERTAEHFLRTEIGAPRYFGREILSAVSSSNVDQYLEVAGELFEEIAAKIKGPRDMPQPLSAERQDALIKRVAQSRWDGLVRRIPRGYEARRFLEGVGAFCLHQTFRPNAPYVPGVSGFAITMDDRKLLIDSPDENIKPFLPLREVLTSLVAHNLLMPQLDHLNNGKSHVVFYLNRLLCVQFGLPLGYGGWRRKSLRDLVDWLHQGAKAGGTEEEPSLV